MSADRYTLPTPWLVREAADKWQVVTDPERHGGLAMAVVDVLKSPGDDGAPLRTANLLKASPDLLAACEVALGWFEQEVNASLPIRQYEVIPDGLSIVRSLRAAIARAKGETP